jgi:F-type H+-transporting ATPase subunit epsilon
MADVKTMQLEIVSAEASILSKVVTSVIVSGQMGELGLYPGHLQLLTSLKPGQVRAFAEDGSEMVFYISGGMLEVQPDQVTVLADTAARAEDLDEAAAKAAEQRAEKILSDKKSELDYSQALIELAEASAQLRAIAQLRKHRR